MCICVFFFKQNTAYEVRISDWSSDVCSSDLRGKAADGLRAVRGLPTAASFSIPARPGVIAVAASTGGPTAMFRLFADLEPLADVPIIVTQHLPAPFVPVLAVPLSLHARPRAGVAEEIGRAEGRERGCESV